MSRLVRALVLGALGSPAWSSDGGVAVCLSGHVRSLVQPAVYTALKANLVDPLGAGTAGGADVFMYVELDQVEAAASPNAPTAAETAVEEAGHILNARLNDDWDPLNPRNCSASELEPALALLRPVVFRLHDEATAPPFPASNCTARAVPQLEKVAACFRLVEQHERARGFRYDWVVRARPDLGWTLPVAPAASFPPHHVYVSPSYWPLADQFALVPRRLAATYFNAARAAHLCVEDGPRGDLQRRWLLSRAGYPEQLIWRHLHDYDVSVRFYPFAFVIVRFEDGGRCNTLHKLYSELCLVMTQFYMTPWPTHEQCQALIASVFQAHCRRAFPSAATTGAARSAENLAASPAASLDFETELRLLEEIGALSWAEMRGRWAQTTAALPHDGEAGTFYGFVSTSTHGLNQGGVVATAHVLDARVLALMAEALLGLVPEMRQLLKRDMALAESNASQKRFGVGARVGGGGGGGALEEPIENEGEAAWARLHAAEMAMSESVLSHATCLEVACDPAGEEIQVLARQMGAEQTRRAVAHYAG